MQSRAMRGKESSPRAILRQMRFHRSVGMKLAAFVDVPAPRKRAARDHYARAAAGQDYCFFRHLPQSLRPPGATGTSEFEFGVSKDRKAKA
ncbi:hypothetical protein BCCGELA001_03530 [Bradyrhizobium sp. CCGE-LA001]|nr:hypothetical protein BCCGELA001_03530 [Bradyrhizobium sp. CCGE-LA001]